MIHQRKILKAIAYAILLCFTSLTGAQPLYAVPANNHTPSINTPGAGVTVTPNGEILNIHQTGQTAVNKWNDFSIGADATVNFTGTVDGFNSFNYVKDGPISEIYGQLNAIGGNIFIANPAGVQIGNSAQINVGSLYVTNRELEQSHLDAIAGKNTAAAIGDYLRTNGTIANPAAELMSLGSITSATSVTFDGSRIVLDTDRLFSGESGVGTGEMAKDNIKIFTNDENEVVLGYTSYTTTDPTDPNAGQFGDREYFDITVKGQLIEDFSGYMWVEDLFQLQAMDTKLDGWFALRNAIDANYTASNGGFNPIGTGTGDDAFTGRFDGLGYNIFGLNINKADATNVGLFGYAGNDAYIRNFTINGGTITGGTNVGAAVGAFEAGAHISNITNTADVSGATNVGGIVGSGTGEPQDTELRDLVNIGSVHGTDDNVGGIIGSMTNVTIAGETYNLGAVTGDKGNVGGIAGLAKNSTIGNSDPEAFQIYNQLNVTGGYNVGGIVGAIDDTGGTTSSKIQNVANHGNVLAEGKSDTDTTYSDNTVSVNDNQQMTTGERNKNVNIANAGGIVGRVEGRGWEDNAVKITDVLNDGDVKTESEKKNYTYTVNNEEKKFTLDQYNAGNVGGIVGYAKNTEITDAENSENHISGAHNVGGVVGHLTGNSTVDSSQNDGGDITATGARDGQSFVQDTLGGSKGNIGNIGGVVGYLDGTDAKVKNSANRGTVHTAELPGDYNNFAYVPDEAKATNVGGVVGKVNVKGAADLTSIKNDADNFYTNTATVSNSYNTGDVRGYTGVGGVVGQMYKGSVAGSYNLGKVQSTRQADPGSVDPVNMGGVVGDTLTFNNGSGAVIYDVYNAGTIGDSGFNYLGRHVGGVVGRLGGKLEKAYNTGDIYNGYSVTGGVVGYWISGDIKNVFNTGNITVVNKDLNARNSLVGGIVGAATTDAPSATDYRTLSYAYNLGTLRSFIPKGYEEIVLSSEKTDNTEAKVDVDKYGAEAAKEYQWIVDNVIFNDGNPKTPGKYDSQNAYQLQNINVVGGIIGGVTEYTGDNGQGWDNETKTIHVNNVYTTGNIYAGRWSDDADGNGNGGYAASNLDRVGAIWASAYTNHDQNNVNLNAAYFIHPFVSNASNAAQYTDPNNMNDLDDDHKIAWEDHMDSSKYKDFNLNTGGVKIDGNTSDYEEGWRMYDGKNGMKTLPMLNAFTPNTAKNDAWQDGHGNEIDSVQYGTAANPLLTIINLKDGVSDIELDWGALGLSGAGSLAVYGGGLTLTGFGSELGRYYNGILFSEGDLYVNVSDTASLHNLGSGSRLYGENVTFNAGENATTLYGDITSTNGSINIIGGDVSVIGSLTSSKKGEATQVEGVAKNGNTADSGVESITMDDLKDPDAKIPTVEKAYSHMANYDKDDPSQAQQVVAGDIKIEASGSAEVLYGNMGEGKIDTQGDFTVSGKESVYVDSDLHIGGDLNLNSDGEIVLDLSNMGDISKENLHKNFLDHFKGKTEGRPDGGSIIAGGYTEGSDAENFMIALDMWDGNKFNLDKYDVADNEYTGAVKHELATDIKELSLTVNGDVLDDKGAQNHTFIWVENAEQLAGIQKYKDDKDKNNEKTNILSYNFALKDNIDASSIKDYTGIASNKEADGKTDEKFTGTFDGRGFAIIGLDVNDNGTTEGKDVKDAGIFGNIGVVRNEEGEVVQTGTVKDLGVYSSKFTGGDTAGAIAGRNEGVITGITTLGNRVEVTGKGATTEITKGESTGSEAGTEIKVGAAGGIAGVNLGTIEEVNVSDTVIAGENADTTAAMTVAGGVAGINYGKNALIGEYILPFYRTDDPGVISNSAVLTKPGNTKNIMHGLGGIAGINEQGISNVAALGVTNGSYGMSNSQSNEYVGGIVGVNYFGVSGVYNESVVIGASNVGGIAGKNDFRQDLYEDNPGIYTGGSIDDTVNAGSVTVIGDGEYAGGIVGSNYGWVNYGRNTGSVSGTNSVGGIAGLNAYGAGLKNLSNAIAAEISGEENVGGIAGTNAGEITAESNIVNEGKITGKTNVGGVAGVNEKTGVIRGGEDESGSKRTTNLATITGNTYVGGIAGVNKGEIANTNSDVTFAFDADASVQYVGGVAGRNEGKITNATNASDIIATNASFVGGITGVNAKDAVLENAGNSGNVSGGSKVGGVAGVNHASHDGGTIINSGTVTAETGGAAGIFYENHAGLSNVTLINSGQVNGGGNTGGVIGVNSGTISGSTLANTGYVKADSGENVGGLIGYNTSTGSVIGGRNEADTMYVHKIYNNGRVSGVTNVGGLIGHNEGKLTAGYNTGNVNGQQNVGGIAGTNNGSISEVFNTVMTGDAEATGSISGVGNVGGLVGHNKGTLTDAYNTTAVNGGGVKGNAVGTNEGAVKNVYAWNTNGKLIGGGSGTKENTYSFVSGDGSANFVIPALGQMESESYEGFDFGSTWKNYDGWSLPMLKVFLTKGEVSQNGVTAADGLAAFNNANSLIVFVPDPETGGMYMTVFSAQIAGSFGPDGVFNPNNLGYDLEGVYVRGNNNGFLHSDGWDRIKNFRERKAELYFHNGGMEYAEEL